MSCVSCNKAIWDESIQAGGKTYHPECFKCSKCKTVIKGQFFTESTGPVCDKCAVPVSDKKCFKCNKFLQGEFRVFKGHNYCHDCAESAQTGEVDQRRDQYGAVVAEQQRVAEMNARLAKQPPRDPKKFDYRERMQWEKEEREKMGIPEPEKKW